MNSTTQTDKHKWEAAVRAALPYFRKQFAASAGADKFAQSRAKHEAMDHATALASGIAVGASLRNPDRPEAKAALKAWKNA